MPDYTKMKNADLESLLKERGLPHTGKKAEMVSRLQDDDSKKAAASGATAEEDEIDWDDDAAEPAPAAQADTSAPATDVAATETNVEGNNPQAVPNQATAIDPSTTEDLAVDAPTDATNGAVKPSGEDSAGPEKMEVDNFSIGLDKTDLRTEIEKHKARAERFKIAPGQEDPAAVEALQKLQRAAKFAAEDTPIDSEQVKILDQPLTDRREKRRRGGDDREDRGDYKRGGRRGDRQFNDRRGGRGPRDSRGPRDDRGPREPRQDRGSWMNEEDRRRAAERKARFEQKQ
jgi:SAP domain-containing ribonucleoprotein